MADVTPSLALLNDEMDTLRDERAQLRAKNPGAVMPEEARVRDAEIVDRMQAVAVLIEREQQRKRDAMFDNTVNYMDDVTNQVPRGFNADDKGRRDLLSAGWDIRGGMVFRRTSNGEVAYCAEDVLFGPIPSEEKDAQQARHMKQMRAVFQPEYRDAYMKWLRSPFKGIGADALALSRLSGAEQNALSEGTGESGGFVVPPDIQAEILQRLAARSVMNRLARTILTSRPSVQFPTIQAASSNGTIYNSGFVGTVVGETPAFAENDPAFGQFEISVKKFRASTKMSNDWFADAASAMIARLSADGGENLALTEDYYFINGDGTPLQPVGLLNAGLSTTTVEGTTTDQVSNTIANAGSASLIDALPYLVPEQYTGNAEWLMNRNTEGKIRALVDANGRPWWMPQQSSGGSGGAPNELGGYPVNNSAWMPVGGTNGNKVLVFGDFQSYIIARRAEITTTVLRERFADNDQTGLILMSRAGGGLWNTDAMYIGIV